MNTGSGSITTAHFEGADTQKVSQKDILGNIREDSDGAQRIHSSLAGHPVEDEYEDDRFENSVMQIND